MIKSEILGKHTLIKTSREEKEASDWYAENRRRASGVINPDQWGRATGAGRGGQNAQERFWWEGQGVQLVLAKLDLPLA